MSLCSQGLAFGASLPIEAAVRLACAHPSPRCIQTGSLACTEALPSMHQAQGHIIPVQSTHIPAHAPCRPIQALPLPKSRFAPAGRYLIVSVRNGCEPTNRLWYVDLERIPRHKDSGALDLGAYDLNRGETGKLLPMIKLVDSFEAQWEVVANEGPVFTLLTNHSAPRYRCAWQACNRGHNWCCTRVARRQARSIF